jgi:hypothetical protein
MSTPTSRSALAWGALLGLGLAAGTGCFNDAFRGPEFNGELGATRFELVIESDRTTVDGSHFLVDRATGDLWVLDARPGSTGGWQQIAQGPADAKPLSEILRPASAEAKDAEQD